jgi:1,4-alpha-glucan branching enzyme
LAVNEYEENFGKKPNGIWLPECAYQPGIEEILKSNGIKFFFLETHGILYATPKPKYGPYAPVYCRNGVAAFARDIETALQVWSAEHGYPGDFDYREFYRDIGFDLDYDYIKPYLHSDGVRRNIGIKYYRITGKVSLSDKQPYNPTWALNKARIHAGNFMFNREHQIKYLNEIFNGKKVIVVSPYDTELFGHWWFEGPEFIRFLFEKIESEQNTFKTITPTEYLQRYPNCQVVEPAASSWGDKGYFEVWLNGTNDWIYRHLHKACERMLEVTRDNLHTTNLTKRIINQMMRELFLALSSDWAFILTTHTSTGYALKRIKEHINNFTELYESIKTNTYNLTRLEYLENKNNIFPHLNYNDVLS